MSLSLLKTGAIAATVLALSVTGAFAAQHGTLNYDTKLKAYPKSASQTVGWGEEDDDVAILDYTNKNGGWFRIKDYDTGDKGWVKKSAVDLDYVDDPVKPGVQFCFNGPFGYVCVNQ
ncbi:MAG: hypothetical protein ABIQ30_01210 [Devosia sp.]